MSQQILGLHHVTAIAGDARRNLDFYTRVLGLRLVKKTVNFDDPNTYHFYFGNETGEPGTIMTFFPWEGIRTGSRGAGQATETAFSVPEGSLEFWQARMEEENIIYNPPAKRFDESYLTVVDPDGLKLELVASPRKDERTPFTTEDINEDVAIRGFRGVTLTLQDHTATAKVLTEVFGYELVDHNVNRYRYRTDAIATANVIDLVSLPTESRGTVAGGSVHHIAFRVADEETQRHFAAKLREYGLHPTQQIDRDYFMAIYFREPGGVLFEIATDPPGFTADEPLATLGEDLKLPKQYEPMRSAIEKQLPALG